MKTYHELAMQELTIQNKVLKHLEKAKSHLLSLQNDYLFEENIYQALRILKSDISIL